MSVVSDMAKAKDLRAQAKAVKNEVAKRKFLDAADRVEARAARGATRIGRRRKKSVATAARKR